MTGRHHHTRPAVMSGPPITMSLCSVDGRRRRRRSRLVYRSQTSHVLVSFARLRTAASLKHLVGFHGTN